MTINEIFETIRDWTVGKFQPKGNYAVSSDIPTKISELENDAGFLSDVPDNYVTDTGDIANTTVTFTSGDSEDPTGWADVDVVTSGEKISSLMRKFSLFAKNMRYLWELMGTTSLDGIGDGTITGAISSLNTGLGDIRANILYQGAFGKGSITPNKNPLEYDLLIFSNAYGGSTVSETKYGYVQASIVYIANEVIYTDVFRFAVNGTSITIESKMRTVARGDGVFYYNNFSEPISLIWGIKIT